MWTLPNECENCKSLDFQTTAAMGYDKLEELKKKQKADRRAALRRLYANAPTPLTKGDIEKRDKERLPERQGLSSELAKETTEEASQAAEAKMKTSGVSEGSNSTAPDQQPPKESSHKKRCHGEEESEAVKKSKSQDINSAADIRSSTAVGTDSAVPPAAPAATTTTKASTAGEGPSWLKAGFEAPVTIVGMEKLADEISDLSPSLANLRISDPKNAISYDPDLYGRISKMSNVEAFNRFGGLISEISTLGLFLADTDKRTDCVAAYTMNIEKNCSQVEISTSEWKVKFEAEERRASLLMNEKNKVQAELTPLQAEVKDLKAQLAASEASNKELQAEVKDLKSKFAASEASNKELADKNAKLIGSEKEAKIAVDGLQKSVVYITSSAFTDRIISEFQKTEEYRKAVRGESLRYFNQGSAHIIRQIYHVFDDKTPLAEAYNMFFAEPRARGGASFVPFSDDEFAAIKDYDEKRNVPPWTPPAKSSPTLFELVDLLLLNDPDEEAGW